MQVHPFSSLARRVWRRLARCFQPESAEPTNTPDRCFQWDGGPQEPPVMRHAPAWAAMPPVWKRCAHVPTMLTAEELQLLYWLTREVYSGRGSVVDCGPFLGGSTAALCAGLADNRRGVPRDGVLHSYDRFAHEPFFDPWLKSLGENLGPGESFLPVYRRLLGDSRRHVVVHAGDLLEAGYEAGPIEILFVDICKSWELNGAVLDRFFPHLIPGTSMLVQQDYLHFYEFWLVITMDYFADYFERVGWVARGSSTVYRYTRRIPEDMLRTDLRALPLERKRLAFEREAARCTGWQRNEVLVGFIRMLLEAGDESGAQEVFQRIDPAWYGHPINKVSLTFVPSHFRTAA